MQKKLLAAAVLSAFAGVASAQSANVTLYGTLLGNFEITEANGADTSAAAGGSTSSTRGGGLSGGAGAFNANAGNQGSRSRMNPAGSNFGFRGTEDLGNGLSAWFQLEFSTALGAPPPNAGTSHGTAPTARNNAMGLRSRTWGTLLLGMWDTPFNQMNGFLNTNNRTGSASTGFHANLLGATTLGYGAVSGQSAASWCGAGGTTAACFNHGTNFDRRERGSVQWWSPNWNGFELKASYGATMDSNPVTASNTVNGRTIKPYTWDLAATYTNGPLGLGMTYAKQKDLLAYSAALSGGAALTGSGTGAFTISSGAGAGSTGASGSDGRAWRMGGRYSFPMGGGSSLGIGAMWESLKWTINYSGAASVADLTELKKTAYRLQGNFVTGNHFFGLEYTRANELKGSIGGTAGNQFNGGGTGARGYILSYNYMMSKRTSVSLYYTAVDNDTNANYSGLVFGGIATAAGANPRYYGAYVRHAF